MSDASRGGEWRDITFVQVAARIEELALGLIATGIAPGDRVIVVGKQIVTFDPARRQRALECAPAFGRD